jgi:hypothetical protein
LLRGALPSATAMLRSQRSWPMRRIGEPARRSLKSLSPRRTVRPALPGRGRARREITFARQRREAVPRAGELAVVAAVDAVAQQRPQRLGMRALELDGQVGNAAPRVEPIGRDDGAGRAGVDAGAAGAAVVGDRRIGRQRQVGEQISPRKKYEPAVAIEQQRVLAAPAQAAVLRQADFHDRRRIGEHPVGEFADSGDAVRQLLQAVRSSL